MKVEQGSILWQPLNVDAASTPMLAFAAQVGRERGIEFVDYASLWQWSVDNIEDFWREIWRFFDIQADGDIEPVLASQSMPGAKWFPNVRLNHAEHVFRNASPDRPAMIAYNEAGEEREISWDELRSTTGALAATLRSLGVGPGDRVVSYMPNIPETIIAFLATASIGAIWSSCSPDMGSGVVLDRVRQIEPKLLFAVDGYRYNGKPFDRSGVVADMLEALPSVEHVIHVPGPEQGDANAAPDWRNRTSWNAAVEHDAALVFTRLPFDHPLWILYSSGTTGLPKAIVHGHGGILLTHLKHMRLQNDLHVGDRMLYLGSTAWAVWNLLTGALLSGATISPYDGNPTWPDFDALWRFMGEKRITHFGCGAAYLIACMKSDARPREVARLDALRSISSTGSPLPLDAYEWVHDNVKENLWLASVSGGTDIASCFVGASPTLPVHAGELQCRELGVAAYAFNDDGQPVVDEVGELVITKPMPSMPVYFWNDADDARYRESYFERFPGVWCHGDWIRFSSRGTAIIYGRSDSTINRHGIRMGTAEIYRVVEALPEIADCMVVDLEFLGRPSFMPLFVVLKPGSSMSESLAERIRQQIRTRASPRHVPDEIYVVDEIPRTLTGKKLEVPVRKLLLGADPSKVANVGTLSSPGSLQFFIDLARRLNDSGKTPEAGQDSRQ